MRGTRSTVVKTESNDPCPNTRCVKNYVTTLRTSRTEEKWMADLYALCTKVLTQRDSGSPTRLRIEKRRTPSSWMRLTHSSTLNLASVQRNRQILMELLEE